MSSQSSCLEPIIVPEFDAADLGIPFKVVLMNSVTQIVDATSGEVTKTIIPNVPGLLKTAAMVRILESRKLSGAELKFVRKVFRISAKKLAERIGVTAEHLSRCESNDRTLSVGAEKCLRISIFLDNFKSPREFKLKEDCGEEIKNLTDVYETVFDYIKSILDEMKINPVHSVDDDFVLALQTHRLSDDLFKDDPRASWHDMREAA